MKVILVALILATSPCLVSSQHLTSEFFFNKIVLLSDSKHSGSGFILASDARLFLVTAKHVADSLDVEKSKIYFRTPVNKSIEYGVKTLIRNSSLRIFNNSSDFFILELYAFDSVSNQVLTASALPMGMIANNRNVLPRNWDLIVFGYPVADLDNFAPITFKSNISSGLMNFRIPGLQKPCYCYLLENPGMEGFSGGPVFVGLSDRSTVSVNKTSIVGIVTGTIFDRTGAKFAVISPTFHLIDLLTKQ